jgi:hypothetical protein
MFDAVGDVEDALAKLEASQGPVDLERLYALRNQFALLWLRAIEQRVSDRPPRAREHTATLRLAKSVVGANGSFQLAYETLAAMHSTACRYERDRCATANPGATRSEPRCM